MPIIVIGADTPYGQTICATLAQEQDREVRAFVSNPYAADELKSLGVKVALGDLSDASHVEAACTNCFSVVLITEAATDDRERAFATTREEVLAGWAEAVTDSAVTRVIWVTNGLEIPKTGIDQTVVIDARAAEDLATKVAFFDGLAVLPDSVGD